MLNFIKNISPTELVLILIILVVLFGGKVISKLGRTGGETVKEIKKVKKAFTDTVQDVDKEVSE